MCIDTYTNISKQVFERDLPSWMKPQIWGQSVAELAADAWLMNIVYPGHAGKYIQNI